jgi:DNA-binding NarL/FixJ family response regulator
MWGVAEAALLAGDAGRAIELSDQARRVSERVSDAAILFPFLITGTRARLAVGDPAAAERWSEQVGAIVGSRAIPNIQAAVHHAHGLVLLAKAAPDRARAELEAALRGWESAGRVWEAVWARTDLAVALMRVRRYSDAAQVLADAREAASQLGSRPLAARAEELARSVRDRHPEADLWRPLTAREFEVARLIARGLTNNEIARELSVSPKTISAHVEHVLAKLGASRRTEIAFWVATVAHTEPRASEDR